MYLFTIGYQGLRIAQFFDLLSGYGVETIVDVRELPLSRKPGFSKTALSTEASVRGLEYVHMSALGSPRDVRHQYRVDGNWVRFVERFEAHLQEQADSLVELSRRVAATRCCLLCFEANAARCHRTLVAQDLIPLMDTSMSIVDITTSHPVKVDPIQESAALAGSISRRSAIDRGIDGWFPLAGAVSS